MSKIMKICIATDAWHPQINGVVTTLSRTAATLQAWGHELLLITPGFFKTFPGGQPMNNSPLPENQFKG